MSDTATSAASDAVANIDFAGLSEHRSGKVRESWLVGSGRRVIATTDRLSAFDRVIGTVPNKGQVLNQLAAWWFDQLSDVIDNHMIEVPDPNLLVAVDAQPLPVEVIVRGRLTGSTKTSVLPRYQAGERVLYGATLPDGLADHGPLPEPLLTPTTKAEAGGHDEPITPAEVTESGLVDPAIWQQVSDAAFELFRRGTEVAAQAGFILADTKYEFGLAPDGRVLLIDEVHTPDSSRYWAEDSLAERLAEGRSPESFDKEPVRLALAATGYRGEGPPPALSDEVRAATSARYIELYERLVGSSFVPGAQPAEPRIVAALKELSS